MYRRALALAEELGMRSLQATATWDPGSLCRRVRRTKDARAELDMAAEMYRSLRTAFSLPQAGKELAETG